MKQIGNILLAVLFAAWAAPASADGALAVGQPSDVAKGGVAFGVTWALPRSEAQQEAVKLCKQTDGVPSSTTALCRVVHTFKHACVSIAFDPQKGTTGFGWGTGSDSVASGWDALDKCKATAGDRASACRLIDTTCD